ncbi:MAG: nucleotidyltransferase family protein [Oleispira sp.]|nr:nucleotidyltransferase family protein [Oleispira sp.]MBL4880328.1 nucleotidyltransferase family protein [Oleispira sp.]
MHSFGILVLAAGQSSRFGSDKLMAEMADNRPMIAHSLAPLLTLAKDNNLELCVITRADNQPLINFLKFEDINYSLCSDAHLGMGHSIAYGVRSHQLWQGWMVALADMPNINIALLTALLEKIRHNPSEIIRPAFTRNKKIKPAHPVYFPRQYGYSLSRLTGDNGAKTIIKQQKLITQFDGHIIEENILIDMDTPESIKKAHHLKSNAPIR